MKKTLSILLAVVLMFAMAIPVLAEDVSESDVSGETSKVVTAQRVDEDDNDPATIYYVTVDWNVTSELKYTVGGSTYTWNPGNTEYTETPGETNWDGSAVVEITVTNKSNDAITAKASWAAAEGITASECKYEGGDGTVTVDSAATGTVLSGEGKNLIGEEKKETIKATVTVTAGSIATNNATVGTVTLSISK